MIKGQIHYIYNTLGVINKEQYYSLVSKLILPFISFCLLCCAFSASAVTPIQYIKNTGQWDEHILYKAPLSGGYLFVEQDKVTFVVSEQDKIHHHELEHASKLVEENEDEIFGSFSYQIEFVNGNNNSLISGLNKSTAYHNYFTHPNPSQWRSNVPLYEKVQYSDMYEGIDVILYGKDNLFEYDFVVHPGANWQQISLKYNGIKNLYVKNGQLHLTTPLGVLVELAPVVFQEINGKRQQIKAQFVVKENKEVGFEILESYDKTKQLTIDPVLVFSTYSGSASDNWGFTATYDDAGNLYSGGMVAGNGYPATIGAYDTIYSGGNGSTQTDIAISKYSPDGRQLIYATYIGGSGNEIPHSLIVSPKNELIIYGSTGSADYPVTLNAYDKTFNGGPSTFPFFNITYPNGSDIIITKLNAAGSNLVGSTFYGGTDIDGLNFSGRLSLEYNYGDIARGDVAIASNDDILIASCTFSNDIPISSNAFQSVKDAGESAITARFNSDLSQLVWSTYIGGSGNDAAYSIELFNDEVIIGGGTSSPDLPGMNGLNTSFQGGQADGFILKLTNDGSTSTAGTYLGTTAYDQVYFLETDIDGNIYALGQTVGNYPVSSNVYSVTNASQFIQELDNNLSQSIYSTVYGSSTGNGSTKRVNISPTAFLVDNCKNIYAIGWGGNVNNGYNSNTGNTNNMATTSDAFMSNTDGSDFYLLVIDREKDLLYASYFGEVSPPGFPLGRDHVDGGTSRFDKKGFVYHASCSSCGGLQNFPTTDSVWSNSNNSSNCNTASFKFEFEYAPILAATNADPISGCPPLEVQFENFSNIEGEYYIWDFDDGTTSDIENPVHIFTDPGVYDVEFIIIDSNNCIIADTAYIQIIVTDTFNATSANFSVSDSGCLRTTISFNNLSENANNYLWDFGDNTTSTDENPEHTYSTIGTYEVVLIADPGSGCSDTFSMEISIFESTSIAEYLYSQAECGDTNIVVQFFDSSFSSIGIVDWSWDFGDGSSSNQENPVHQFSGSGQYTVTLTITDAFGCFDFVSKDVIVTNEVLEADFEALPNCNPFVFGTQFMDLSGENSTITQWQWDFGDGNTDIVENPIHFYSVEGDYDVQLIVTNDLGCIDTITKTITVEQVNINVSFSTNSLVCNDPTVGFTNTTTSEDSVVMWEWDFGDGNFSNEENPTHTYSSVGSYFVILTATTVSGCESSTSIFLTIPFLDVDYTITAPSGCSNINLPFSFSVTGTTSSGIGTTEWNFGDGTPTVSGLVVSHSFAQAGIYNVQFAITNVQGCADTVVYPITISDEVPVTIAAQTLSCGSLTVDFDAALTTTDTITSITWDFGDGTTIQNDVSPTHTYADTGSYTVQATVVTSSGCDGFGTIDLVLEFQTLEANFIASADGCDPSVINFTNQSISSDTSVQYYWLFGDGDTLNSVNPIHIYDSSGNYTVILFALTDEGCNDSASLNLTIEINEIELADTLTICEGDSVRLNLTTNFGSDFLWTPATFLDNNTLAQPIATPNTSIWYTVQIEEILTNGDTCLATDSVFISVNSNPLVVATSDQYTVLPGTTINLNATNGFETYAWEPAATLSDATVNDPTAIINDDIIFEVTVTDINGCRNSDTVNITVLESDECNFESLYIPNAFSPNGDGQNDKLFVRLMGIYDRLDFRIHNRWGELVFETNDINRGWDGVFKGKLQSTDVFGYFLEIECNGEIIQQQGNITLVR
ncbi:MAG: PKD domain-containing protein [Chitinophagales bacterium]